MDKPDISPDSIRLSKFQQALVIGIANKEIVDLKTLFFYPFGEKILSNSGNKGGSNDLNIKSYYFTDRITSRTFYFGQYRFIRDTKVWYLNGSKDEVQAKVQEFLILVEYLTQNNMIVSIDQRHSLLPLFEMVGNEHRPCNSLLNQMHGFQNRDILPLPALFRYMDNDFLTDDDLRIRSEHQRHIFYKKAGLTLSLVAIVSGLIGFTLKDLFTPEKNDLRELQSPVTITSAKPSEGSVSAAVDSIFQKSDTVSSVNPESLLQDNKIQ